MKHKRPPIPVIVILLLAVLVGGYFGVRALLDGTSSVLTASGTIEAVEVTISPEIGGKVVEVPADEGSHVKTGEVLFRLDDTLLQAQRKVAAASLDLAQAAADTAMRAQDTAEANYTLALDAARAESVSTRTADWRAANSAQYSLPGGYFSQNELLTAAAAAVDSARLARDAAQTTLNDLVTAATNADFVSAERRLDEARASFLVDQDVLNRANISTNADLRDSAQAGYDSAKTELEDAQSAYDELKDTDGAKSIIAARADLASTQETYETAQDRMLALQTGVDSPKVAAAQAVLNQAVEAAVQAQKAVAQAQANLDLIDVQIGKLTVTAPGDGVILTRAIQPGEVVAPNASAMTLGELADLTITVYVPEDRYGEIFMGQSATVSVDSFPGETFPAQVVHIADQAEFTPRNVQTVAGRSSTVFAIKLQVQNTSGRLKPGMPADVTFGE
jgi:HlyD family secretion protein